MAISGRFETYVRLYNWDPTFHKKSSYKFDDIFSQPKYQGSRLIRQLMACNKFGIHKEIMMSILNRYLR